MRARYVEEAPVLVVPVCLLPIDGRSKLAIYPAGRVVRARWAGAASEAGLPGAGRGTRTEEVFGALMLRPVPCEPAKTLHQPISYAFPSEEEQPSC